MTIEDKFLELLAGLERISGAKTAIKNAIEAKGVAVPAEDNIDSYSSKVAEIESIEIGEEKVCNIQYNPYDDIFDLPINLESDQPISPTYSYTISENNFPTITGDLLHDYKLVYNLHCFGEKLSQPNASLYYLIRVNGALITNSSFTIDNNKYSFCSTLLNNFNLNVGDIIDVYLWGSNLSFNRIAFLTHISRPFVSSNIDSMLMDVSYVETLNMYDIDDILGGNISPSRCYFENNFISINSPLVFQFYKQDSVYGLCRVYAGDIWSTSYITNHTSEYRLVSNRKLSQLRWRETNVFSNNV